MPVTLVRLRQLPHADPHLQPRRARLATVVVVVVRLATAMVIHLAAKMVVGRLAVAMMVRPVVAVVVQQAVVVVVILIFFLTEAVGLMGVARVSEVVAMAGLGYERASLLPILRQAAAGLQPVACVPNSQTGER